MHVSISFFVAIPINRSVFYTPTETVQNRCDSSHISDLGAKFCAECGKPPSLRNEEVFSEVFVTASKNLGFESPEVAFKDLLNDGWTVDASDGTPCAVNLTSISAESDESGTGEQVYGLGVRVATLSGLGDGDYQTKVLALPISDYAAQVASIKQILGELNVISAAELAIYPHVSIG